MRLALYQPEIPQNTGTLIRLGACLNVGIDIIEPCGFVLDDKKMLRAGMDYVDLANMERHVSWQHFLESKKGSRLILLSTESQQTYTSFSYRPDDILLVGQESVGVPQAVVDTCDASVLIPMNAEVRSLNVAVAASMVVGESLRQTQQFPE